MPNIERITEIDRAIDATMAELIRIRIDNADGKMRRQAARGQAT